MDEIVGFHGLKKNSISTCYKCPRSYGIAAGRNQPIACYCDAAELKVIKLRSIGLVLQVMIINSTCNFGMFHYLVETLYKNLKLIGNQSYIYLCRILYNFTFTEMQVLNTCVEEDCNWFIVITN